LCRDLVAMGAVTSPSSRPRGCWHAGCCHGEDVPFSSLALSVLPSVDRRIAIINDFGPRSAVIGGAFVDV